MSRNQTRLGLAALAASLIAPAAAASDAAPAGPPVFPVLSDAEAWAKLPPATIGAGRPLPSWARMTAEALPKTTAAMLRLDYVQRARSPLDPKLRAAMRYVAARANRSAYGEAYALADAERAGLAGAALDALRRGDASGWSPAERAALEFAREMTVDSASVTDEEFAALVADYGEKGAAAMVLLAAYANFQDRLLLCLRAPVEDGGPTPPTEFAFKPEPTPRGAGMVGPRPADEAPPASVDVVADDPEWTSVSFEELQERMERQRSRPTRVRVPTWEEVQAAAPDYYPPGSKPVRVVWGLVCAGLQPELAIAWNATMWTFWAESAGALPSPFPHSIFWVTTRAVDCPYCMGHSEMIMELNGLTRPEIDDRARRLASGDWSGFRPEEQRTFAFARKLAREPWAVDAEVETIRRDFDPRQAMVILWNTSHGHYMTRVSNGFQLTLERDNVFRDRAGFQKPDAPAPSR